MKFFQKLKIVLPVLLVVIFAFSFAACGEETSDGENGGYVSEAADKKVAAIEVATEPDKTEYFVGEEFEIAGASVKVTYEDDTEETLALPAKGITISNPTMTSAGTKNITVTPDQRTSSRVRATIRITVRVQGFDFTYDYNYEGAENVTENVSKDTVVRRPATDPARDGYTFYDWYADEDCTVKYDFSTLVTADTTVYAAWKDNAATYYEFTYDLNYYGVAPQQYVQIVKSGEKAKALGITAERSEFTFNGWFANAGATQQFNADAAITADTTVYAGWTKTKTGSSTYTFEAEHTDLAGKVGPGYSGEAVGEGMIVNDDTGSASNGAFVSYLYKNGLSLEFYIASSEATTATLVLRLAEEFEGITLTDSTYQIRLYHSADSNDYTTVNYGSVRLNGGNFTDAISVTIELSAGYNLIQLVTNNSTNPAGEGNGTYAGTAPMVDCIKLTTTAVLTWDGNKGLPKQH